MSTYQYANDNPVIGNDPMGERQIPHFPPNMGPRPVNTTQGEVAWNDSGSDDGSVSAFMKLTGQEMLGVGKYMTGSNYYPSGGSVNSSGAGGAYTEQEANDIATNYAVLHPNSIMPGLGIYFENNGTVDLLRNQQSGTRYYQGITDDPSDVVGYTQITADQADALLWNTTGINDGQSDNTDGYSLVYSGNFVNSYRTQGTLSLYNNGKLIMGIPAASGSGGKLKGYTLPPRDYTVNNFRTTTDSKFMRYGIGFKLDISQTGYDPLSGHTFYNLEIHPVPNLGTLGCIGLIGNSEKIQQFENNVSAILETQPNIPLHVSFGDGQVW